MDVGLVLHGISIVLQYAGAVLALALMRVTRRSAAWLLIAAAVLLMAVRYTIDFVQVLTHHRKGVFDPSAELLTLAISMLMVAGIGFIGNLFQSIIRSENALRLTQFTLDHAGDAVCWVDENGRVFYVNETACRLLDATREVLQDRIIMEVVPELTPDAWARLWRWTREKGSSTFESSLTQAEGRLLPVELTVNYLEFGARKYICVLARDITERRQAEEALREHQRRLTTLVNNLPGTAYRGLNDQERSMVYLSEGCAELTGYPPEDLSRNTLTSFGSLIFSEDQRPVWNTIQRALTKQRHFVLQYRIINKSGEMRWVWEKGCGVFNDDGELVAVEGFITDITEHKQGEEERAKLEAQLSQARKMEATGKLAGSIANDFNNLLMGIMGHASMLKRQTAPGTSAHAIARTIERAGERASLLTSQLMGFARKGKYQNIPVNVHDVVGEVVRLLSGTLEKNEQIRTFLRADHVAVMGDPGQLHKVIMNLALNALEALDERGGEVTIETGMEEIDRVFCRRHPGFLPGDFLKITVSDTGKGIPHDVLEHAFDPFFTTKDPMAHSGMGLATVYGIVENHGGCVLLDSSEGEGTIVTVYLPSAGAIMPDYSLPRLVRGSGRIMVVDDEEIVRTYVAELLQSLGYEVVVQPGGQEAVDYYLQFGPDIDLVLLDLVMPEMDGRECFHALRLVDPHVRAILSSGYNQEQDVQAILDEGFLAFIRKPFSINELSALLADALARSPHEG